MGVKKVIKEVWRFPFRVICKIRLKKHGFSLISSNCIGGGYYHDCFSKFYSPTINLTIGNSIGFFENIKNIWNWIWLMVGLMSTVIHWLN